MIIAQITDTHVTEPGRLLYGRLDTAPAFRRCIEALEAFRPRIDLVLHTGDLVDRGSAAEYDRFLSILGDLRLPFAAIPGNHDRREDFRAAFAGTDWLPTEGRFLSYVIDHLPVRIVCCDSMIPGSAHGEMCDDRLAWLDATLAAAPDRPTVVAMHHPPFATGIRGLGRDGLERGGPELAALLARHRNVVRLIAGHVHRPVTVGFGGTVACSAPAVCFPFDLDMTDGAPLSISFEPSGFAVHIWSDDDAGLVTHSVPLADVDPPLPFLKDGKRLIEG